MFNYTFANPGFLYLLLLLIPMIAWYVYKQKDTHSKLQISTIKPFKKHKTSFRRILLHFLFGLRVIILALLIIVLARPQSTDRWSNKETEGIDIIISLDISGSMLAGDFKPNRLEASKDIACEFITGRPNDRIGIVVFSGESFTQCPLTTDHASLINLIKEVKNGLIEDGTAIGNGLANAINRLKDSKAVSKVIILLTDGINNKGSVAPLTAAEIAKTYGIRVYTIGVGTKGKAPMPVTTPFGIQYQNVDVNIDEQLLTKIAEMTGGKYFRATDIEKLREIYKKISEMEKTIIDVKQYSKKHEEYFWFAFAAGIAFLIEILLRLTVLRYIP
ncbi:MAG: VWA domain-containing protein [Marinilabiliales bacterium]